MELNATSQQGVPTFDTSETPLEARLAFFLQLVQRVFAVPMVAASVMDQHGQWHHRHLGFSGPGGRARGDALCRHATHHPDVLVLSDGFQVEDLQIDPDPDLIGGGDVRFCAGQPLYTPGGERIGALWLMGTEPQSFEIADRKLLGQLGAWAAKVLALDAELGRAAEVQRMLNPRAAPEIPGYQLAGRCLPAQEVGGDFFDWYLLGGRLQLHLADVMGKGLPAAMIAASVRAVLRGASRFGDQESTVNRAAEGLEMDLEGTSTFVTAFSARLDPASGGLDYVDAGHGLAAIVGNGRHRLLGSHGPPIGAVPKTVWGSSTEHLAPGETLIAVSDGFLEFFPGIDDAVEKAIDVARTSATVDEVVQRFQAYAEQNGHFDDVTVIALHRNRL